MTLFWILSKNRSIIGSRVDPRLGMGRLGVLGQLFPNISMEILRSSKSMILSDLVAFYAIFGLKWVYFGQYDFQKSIFSPYGMNGYEHDLGREKTNLDVLYTILNFFFAQNTSFSKNPQKTAYGQTWWLTFLFSSKILEAFKIFSRKPASF